MISSAKEVQFVCLCVFKQNYTKTDLYLPAISHVDALSPQFVYLLSMLPLKPLCDCCGDLPKYIYGITMLEVDDAILTCCFPDTLLKYENFSKCMCWFVLFAVFSWYSKFTLSLHHAVRCDNLPFHPSSHWSICDIFMLEVDLTKLWQVTLHGHTGGHRWWRSLMMDEAPVENIMNSHSLYKMSILFHGKELCLVVW